MRAACQPTLAMSIPEARLGARQDGGAIGAHWRTAVASARSGLVGVKLRAQDEGGRYAGHVLKAASEWVIALPRSGRA